MSRAGDFASSRRPRVADHSQFVWAKAAAGVPASAIARMINCHAADVQAFLRPSDAAPVAEPTERPNDPAVAKPMSREPRRFVKAQAAPMIETARPIVERHAERARVSVDTLLGRVFPRKLRDARNACWAELHATGRYSLPQIGGWFNRHHSSIHSGIARASARTSPDLNALNRLGDREAA